MKKLQVLVLAAAIVGSASVATAQDPQPQGQGQGRAMGGGMGANRGMGMLMQGITLSAEQQVRMDSIAAKYQRERQAIVADTALGAARREKMREMMGKQQIEIRGILTAEQVTVFDKNLTEMQARMQQGGGQRPPQR